MQPSRDAKKNNNNKLDGNSIYEDKNTVRPTGLFIASFKYRFQLTTGQLIVHFTD